ncbi:MAG TPA: TetR/AcrR family transcriptional regulator [Acidimicrobiales bacterium]|nr:TetR/AcrR family transcriptional regulator [Acidimicrobiales bacterium]
MIVDGRKVRAAKTHSVMHDKILEAARELLQATEFIDLTIPMIAQHVGCSVPTIYNHFPGALQDIYIQVTEATIRKGLLRKDFGRGRLSPSDYMGSLLEGLAETVLENKNVAAAIMTYAPQAAAEGNWDPELLQMLEPPIRGVMSEMQLLVDSEEVAFICSVIIRGAVTSWTQNYITDKEFYDYVSQSFLMAIKIVSD